MKSFVVILFLLLASCQKVDGDRTNKYDKYFDDFNSDLNRLGYVAIDHSQTQILITNQYPKIGLCHRQMAARDGLVTITFDRSFEILPEYIQRIYFYHELGHCFLGLTHTSDASIMTDKDISDVFAVSAVSNYENRLRMVQEMLSRSSYPGL